MTDLDSFEEGLATHIDRQATVRPFVCDGSPLGCAVFIVGFNPATETTARFWDFWQAGKGFNKDAWFKYYLEERQRRPLKPGRRRRSAVSPSRRVIEWIVEEARPISILETNLHAIATEKQADLAKRDRQTDIFDFLMAAIGPTLIVAHGKKATDYVKRKGVGVTLLDVPHFSRGWSEARARDLGRQIRQACIGAA